MTAELWWTVALEAALFFSIPSWALTVNGAWPGNGPFQFAVALFIGASAALMLCHVVPATCAATLRALFDNRVGRILRWPVGAWFCLGAATSFGQLAHLSGSMLVLWRNAPYLREPVWIAIGLAATFVCVLTSLVLAWQCIGRQWPLIALPLLVGLCLSLSAVGAQSRGLRIRNPQLVTEEGLGDPFKTAEGMLIAAAPASILAFRIGKMGLSRRQVWWTGICGVWLPLLASVTLVSLAKMAGARLYWKPSLPIEFTYAFVWLFRVTDKLATLLWPLSLTILGPCLICAMWIKDWTYGWRWSGQKVLAFTVLAVAAYGLTSSFFWALYYPYWLWSIVIASLMRGVARLFFRFRLAIRPSPAVHPGNHDS